jgi:hypothetical protein
MLFGSTTRRFGTISIFPSIPMATYRIMHALSSESRTGADAVNLSQPRRAASRGLDRRRFQAMPLHHVERGQQLTDQCQDRPQQRALIGRD